MEQQVTALARAGIVRCRRGAAGGCSLARGAREITVFDVVQAVQGEILDVPHVTGSAASSFWALAAEQMSEFLATVSLADLAEQQRELDRVAATMYWI